MGDSQPQIQISSEVKEVLAICIIGILVYVVLVCRILCRAPARLAEGLVFDVDPDKFNSRKPEHPDGYFHSGSEPAVVSRAPGALPGRVVVDRGRAKFKLGEGEAVEINARTYGAFGGAASFQILGGSEDLLYHLDLYDGGYAPAGGASSSKDKTE